MTTIRAAGSVVFLLSALGLCVSCVTGRTRSIEHYARVRGCDQKQVEAKPQPGSRYLLSGCGPAEIYECEGLRCFATRMMVAQRHGQLYRCNYKTVIVEPLSGGGWQAEGCNRRAAYRCAMVVTRSASSELQCAMEGRAEAIEPGRPAEPEEAEEPKEPSVSVPSGRSI